MSMHSLSISGAKATLHHIRKKLNFDLKLVSRQIHLGFTKFPAALPCFIIQLATCNQAFWQPKPRRCHVSQLNWMSAWNLPRGHEYSAKSYMPDINHSVAFWLSIRTQFQNQNQNQQQQRHSKLQSSYPPTYCTYPSHTTGSRLPVLPLTMPSISDVTQPP